MECHVLRGFLKYRSPHAGLGKHILSSLKASNVCVVSFHLSDRRLYHHDRLHLSTRVRRVNLLSSPALSTNGSFLLRPQQTRTIIISRVIDALRSADLTSLQGVNKFILESSPVSAVSSFYEWSEAVTGLPWAANIVLCSTLLQLIFSVPANVYMARWTTAREKCTGDLLAIRSSTMRNPSKEGFAMFARAHVELTKQYGCQNYKWYLSMLYQVVCVTISSFGIRSLLLNPNLNASSAMLPWGTCLGLPDFTFIAPVVTVALNLLLVEVVAWKRLRSADGLKMTLRRASMSHQPDPLYLLNLRRFCCIPIVIIYSVVPSALSIHWAVMAASSVNAQILLAHRQTRQSLGVPQCYFETDSPYKDFLQYLRNDMTLLGKKS